ncbi:hypothetical protein BUALT_Bualt03G0117100 [Buddleja alternifolia]|uniref:AT hook motif-containing protein n=1 Tax=Buddleja alternifolia TaxID=168488 RepID=A0AAV6XZS3_9LAMI|nr:hypothetical protein BUALT_Bualt03G0117100 [Buddleja alternifolia]
MDQFNQGESSGGPSIHLAKRGRGRPRKDPSLKRAQRARPGLEVPKQHLSQRADRTVAIDPMVGQSVTGVIEATFDAGYLLSVRIANSNTNLRGVVFKPGHYVPITAENDVAPHVQMIRRNDVHVPAEKLAMQTGPSKRKYAPPKTAPSVHPVGERGKLVPVVLQPVNLPNGLQQNLDSGEREVQMVEPLSMLPPGRSIPVSQTFVAAKQNSSNHRVAHGSEQDDNGSFNEGTSEVGQGEKTKLMTSDIDTSGSSQTSDFKIENVREVLKNSTVSKQESGSTNGPFLTECLQSVTLTKPFFSYGTGRMTELLQAVQGNMKENQVQISEQTAPASKVKSCEKMSTDADQETAASVL